MSFSKTSGGDGEVRRTTTPSSNSPAQKQRVRTSIACTEARRVTMTSKWKYSTEAEARRVAMTSKWKLRLGRNRTVRSWDRLSTADRNSYGTESPGVSGVPPMRAPPYGTGSPWRDDRPETTTKSRLDITRSRALGRIAQE